MNEQHEEISVTVGSGNVFADLGLPDAKELQLKAALVYQIALEIERQGLTETQAAELLRVEQPKVSALLHGRLRCFSIDQQL